MIRQALLGIVAALMVVVGLAACQPVPAIQSGSAPSIATPTIRSRLPLL